MSAGNPYTDRKYVVGAIAGTIVLIFIIRLFYLQIINEDLKIAADSQAFRYVPVYAERGNIFDRNGKRLVYNQAAYDLMVTPKQIKNLDTAEFCKTLGIDKETFLKRMLKAVQKPNSAYKPSIFAKELSVENSSKIQEKLYLFPGFYVQSRTLRKYPMSVAAHILGYVGEVSPEIVDTSKYYRNGDYTGISGIEKSYEYDLRGVRGTKIVMMDVNNIEKGSYKNGQYDTLAVAGKDLVSTLDLDLQLYAEQLLKNKLGSVVAIEPSTGEILILATSPTYDPNLLVGSIRSENYLKLKKDSMNPLFNRALMASYPPGSTFKIVQALIAQQEGILTSESRLPCNFTIAGKQIHCHNHGSPNLTESIQKSCNPYYCRTFVNIINKYPKTVEGYLNWKKHVNSMGFGVKLNTDIPNELRGNIPSVEYYDKFHGKGRWKASSIYSLGIGQGEVGATPLQLANYCATIANRGFYYIPHIIKKVEGGQIDKRFKEKHFTTIESKYYDVVYDAMLKVVEAGTAANGKISFMQFCGKTGTAQNPHGDDHSLFIAFAPKDNPKIALAVVIENAGFGSTWAVPIASLLIEKYLTGKITRAAIEKQMLDGVVLPVKGKKKNSSTAD